MKILYVTNMYPSAETPFDGVFIQEQIQYCQGRYNIYPELFIIERSGNKYLNYFKSIFQIKKVIAKGNFDLVHVHFGLAGMFMILKPLIKTPVVVTLHGSDIISFKNRDGLMQKVSKMAVNNADKVIILNNKMASVLKKYQHKLVKIPCGINTEIFEVNRNNFINERFLIGFPSDRNREVKNYPLFKSITNIITEKGYKIETIEFSNFSRKEMAYNLSKLDCLLMTSHSEGSPQIIKEAMVCGVPIISTKVGDVETLLKGLEHCYVIDSFEPTAFVEKVIEIIKLLPEDRRTHGRERITELKLDQETVCSEIYGLYESIINHK